MVSKLDKLAELQREAAELQREAAEQQREIMSAIKQIRVNKKLGSNLSNDDFSCFATTILDWVNLEDKNYDAVQIIRDRVIEYTKTLQGCAIDLKDTAEVRIVQPQSRALLQSLYEKLLEMDDRSQVELRYAGESTSSFLEYSTILQTPSSDKQYEVTGKTDATLMLGESPILVWEDKNLCEVLYKRSHCAQLLAELKGFAEKFKNLMGIEPPLMAGVLTSGLTWRFAFRIFRNGHVNFVMTDVAQVSRKVCDIKDEIEHCIDISQVCIVSNMLLHCINASKHLIGIVKKRKKEIARLTFADELDDDDGDDDEADEDHDDSDDGRKKNLDTVVTDFNNKVNLGVQTSSKQKSNTHTKRAPFVTLNENTLLTRENLYKHNLGNDTRRLFW